MRRGLALAGFLVVTLAVSSIGVLFPPGNWYAELVRPRFAPPNWLFGPVWITLYVMMAVAAWLVWRADAPDDHRHPALTAWGVQLALNAAWTPLFFGAHAMGLAFLEIFLLGVAILVTIRYFLRVRPLAAALLVPYLLWVAFATALNGAFWLLNR